MYQKPAPTHATKNGRTPFKSRPDYCQKRINICYFGISYRYQYGLSLSTALAAPGISPAHDKGGQNEKA